MNTLPEEKWLVNPRVWIPSDESGLKRSARCWPIAHRIDAAIIQPCQQSVKTYTSRSRPGYAEAGSEAARRQNGFHGRSLGKTAWAPRAVEIGNILPGIFEAQSKILDDAILGRRRRIARPLRGFAAQLLEFNGNGTHDRLVFRAIVQTMSVTTHRIDWVIRLRRIRSVP